MAVFGDSTFATNKYWRQLFNDALVLSVTGWLAGEARVTIGHVRCARRARFTPERVSVFYLSVLVIPELILLLGVAVWWRRSALWPWRTLCSPRWPRSGRLSGWSKSRRMAAEAEPTSSSRSIPERPRVRLKYADSTIIEEGQALAHHRADTGRRRRRHRRSAAATGRRHEAERRSAAKDAEPLATYGLDGDAGTRVSIKLTAGPTSPTSSSATRRRSVTRRSSA
jgi:hypothetical protein